ncbi:MAG: hypothetical protein WBD20_22775 [Pirellulaceae bacterium]
MRVSFAIVTLLVSLISLASPSVLSVRADDDLFSEISMSEVFEQIGAKTEKKTSSDAKKPVRRIDIQSLINPQPKVAASKPIAQEPAKAVATPNLTLVGVWSATISEQEAFAISIAADRRFHLVHVKNDKSQTSDGVAAKSGTKLTLTGDDKTTISGNVVQTTNDEFRLDINGTDGKVALSLNFKKAKQ